MRISPNAEGLRARTTVPIADLASLPVAPLGRNGWPWTRQSAACPATRPDGTPWPRVSIVTPSYNQGPFIEETIRSVLLQRYPNLEYIVIDGGSRDAAVEIIGKYAPWISYWVSEKDRGQSDAINKGWRAGRGDIMAYLNSDDILEPNAVVRVVRALTRHPTVDFVFGSCELIDGSSKVIRTWNPAAFDRRRLAFGNSFAQQTVFFRRRILEQVGDLDEQFHFVMDYEYWLRAALAGAQFRRLAPPALAGFRQWANAKSWTQYQRFKADRLAMVRKHFGDSPRSTLGRIAWAGAYHDAAWFEYAQGHTGAALADLRRSLLLMPRVYLPDKAAAYLFLLGKILIWTRVRARRQEPQAEQ